jgi:hypothetical protein
MTRHERLVLKRLDARDAALRRCNERLAAARLAVVNCTHPNEARVEYHWEHDDGYGHQRAKVGMHCRICERVNPYPSISTHWIVP